MQAVLPAQAAWQKESVQLGSRGGCLRSGSRAGEVAGLRGGREAGPGSLSAREEEAEPAAWPWAKFWRCSLSFSQKGMSVVKERVGD